MVIYVTERLTNYKIVLFYINSDVFKFYLNFKTN